MREGNSSMEWILLVMKLKEVCSLFSFAMMQLSESFERQDLTWVLVNGNQGIWICKGPVYVSLNRSSWAHDPCAYKLKVKPDPFFLPFNVLENIALTISLVILRSQSTPREHGKIKPYILLKYRVSYKIIMRIRWEYSVLSHLPPSQVLLRGDHSCHLIHVLLEHLK